MIFNWYWTGTGEFSQRHFFPSITDDFNEFKDYSALYIPLLSFCASMFAGLAIFLVFYDWKDQHNKIVYSSMAKEVFNILNVERKILNDASFFIKSLKNISSDNIYIILSQMEDIINKLVLESNVNSTEIQGFITLTEDSFINDVYLNYITNIQKVVDHYMENKLFFSKEIDDFDIKSLFDDYISSLKKCNFDTMMLVKKEYLIIQ